LHNRIIIVTHHIFILRRLSTSSSRPSDSAAILDAADDRNRNPASLALFLTEASCWDFLQ
jgi:hypothetical protein